MILKESVVSGVKTGREEQLQFLRFLAFLNIFIYHSEQWLFFRYPVSHCGFSAVSFFFMLSGLVSGYTMIGKPEDLGWKTIGAFLWKRICRLYPLYFCTVLFTVLFTQLPEMLLRVDFSAAAELLGQLLRTILLLQAWFPDGYYAYNGVGWYLSVMVFLYALTPLAMAVLRKVNSHPKSFLLFILMGGSLLFAAAAYCYVTQRMDMSYWHYIFPPARLGEYLAGMVMGAAVHSVKNRIPMGSVMRIVFTVLEIAVLIYWFRQLSFPGNYWRNHIVSWLIPSSLVLLVFSVGAGWISGLFRWRPLVRLGDASFACYLIHQILINLYNTQHPAASLSLQGKEAAFLYCLTASVLFALCLNKKK